MHWKHTGYTYVLVYAYIANALVPINVLHRTRTLLHSQ